MLDVFLYYCRASHGKRVLVTSTFIASNSSVLFLPCCCVFISIKQMECHYFIGCVCVGAGHVLHVLRSITSQVLFCRRCYCHVSWELTNGNKQNSYLIRFRWFGIEHSLLLCKQWIWMPVTATVCVRLRYTFLFQWASINCYPRWNELNSLCFGCFFFSWYLLEQLWLQRYSVGIHFCEGKKRAQKDKIH